MTFTAWLNRWHMTKLSIKTPIAELEWQPNEKDREAAWELYIELLTRITTQPLPVGAGDEKAALESVHDLFQLTRDVLKTKGRDCVEFTKIAIIVLNQKVRPFTSKWHQPSLQGTLSGPDRSREFRADLEAVQGDLRIYTHMLADIAGVEDLTDLAID